MEEGDETFVVCAVRRFAYVDMATFDNATSVVVFTGDVMEKEITKAYDL